MTFPISMSCINQVYLTVLRKILAQCRQYDERKRVLQRFSQIGVHVFLQNSFFLQIAFVIAQIVFIAALAVQLDNLGGE